MALTFVNSLASGAMCPDADLSPLLFCQNVRFLGPIRRVSCPEQERHIHRVMRFRQGLPDDIGACRPFKLISFGLYASQKFECPFLRFLSIGICYEHPSFE